MHHLKHELTLLCLVFFLGCMVGGFAITHLDSVLASSLTGNVLYSPGDYLDLDAVRVYDDKIVIFVEGASISNYAPTGSMRPLIDEHTNGIRIIPQSPDEIVVGDLVTYLDDDDLIIHRVIRKGVDEKGVYFILQGDTNLIRDRKVRFEEIAYKTIGLLY